ncbi:MAG: hypothetical protein ACQESH_02200 [Campylobacterota bacterium]
MAVTALGNVIQVNQNIHLAANKVSNVMSRIDVQDLAAREIAKEQKKSIEEVKPAEETYKVNPDNEREKDQARQERYRQSDGEEEDDEQPLEDDAHHIDISV